MSRLAIIAALDRELHPFVHAWIRRTVIHSGKTFRGFQGALPRDEGEMGTDEGPHQVFAVASGIGCSNAESAARAMMAEFHPQVLVSAGLAGALIRSLKVGNVVTPNVIIDAASGTEYRCQMGGEVVGGGVLVSAAEIADHGAKASLVDRFHALAVDMEAAGVAKVAREFGVGFRCVKSISDEFDFVMPPMKRFVDTQGVFQTRQFAAWTILRPQYWSSTVRLGRNSRRAARALSDWLRANLKGNVRHGTVVTLERADWPKA